MNRVLALDHLQLVKLFLEEPFLRFARQRDALETRVRDDDGIPISRGDAAEQLLAVLRFKVLLARDQDVRAGIQRQQFGENWPSMWFGTVNIGLRASPAVSTPSPQRPS